MYKHIHTFVVDLVAIVEWHNEGIKKFYFSKNGVLIPLYTEQIEALIESCAENKCKNVLFDVELKTGDILWLTNWVFTTEKNPVHLDTANEAKK